MSSPSGDIQTTPAAGGRYGEVFDRGYQHYQGVREGRPQAIRALILYSIRRGLGVKKRWTAKIIPIFLYSASFLPVVTIIGIRAFVGDVASGFNYSFLYNALAPLLLIFAAAGAPEMLCDDRRENVLPLYFSRPITRADYLLAKIGALGLLMASIAIVPPFVLFLGNTLLAESVFGYLRSNISDVGRILATGALLSIFYAAIGLVIAAYTERKGVAAAIYVGFVLIWTAIIRALYAAMESSWRDFLGLIDVNIVPTRIIEWMWGPASGSGGDPVGANIHGVLYLVSVALVTAICAVVMYRRYLAED